MSVKIEIFRYLVDNFRNKYPEANHDKFKLRIDTTSYYGHIEWKYNRMIIMTFKKTTDTQWIDDLSPRLKRLLLIDLGLDDEST